MALASGVKTAIEIFRYLAEYTQLRMRQQRALDGWEMSWSSDWPDEIEVGSAFRIRQEELDPGLFLSVKKPERRPAPTPHPDLLPWFDKPSLTDSSLDDPRVKSEISVMCETTEVDADGDPIPAEPQIVMLNDRPDTLEAIRRYVSSAWRPWAEADRRQITIQSLYGTLFSWWQRQTQLGEKWELVLGIGLLTWRDKDSSDLIRRPLVTVPATIEMDAEHGSFSVNAQVDGTGPALELDMLSPGQRPNADSMRKMRDLVTACGDEAWDRSTANGILRTVANLLAPDGVYDETDVPTKSAESYPRVAFAPGLFMRKRTEKSIHTMLSTIEGQLADSGYLPPGIAAVLGIQEAPSMRDASEPDEISRLSPDWVDEMVFFPKKSNDEQRMIVRRLALSKGGLIVQGPPGTGKSHTIANLVCDVLARGDRVLVTSKGPRALRVLRDMLPPEVQDLCVLLLGADLESNQSLERSIRAISEQHEKWQPEKAEARRTKLREVYATSRKSEQSILSQLRELREAETAQETVAGGAYSGTPSSVAERVRTEVDSYGWIAEFFAGDLDSGDCPLDQEACDQLAKDLAAVSPEIIDELETARPDLSSLPQPSEIRRMFDAEREATAAVEAAEPHSNDSAWVADLHETRTAVLDLRSGLRRVAESGGPAPVGALMRECIVGDPTQLTEEVALLGGMLSQMGDEDLLDAEILLPAGVSMAQARSDAQRLRAHMNAGKSLGFGPVRPKLVKECRYLLEDVRVQGVSCSDPSTLERLVAAVDDRQRVWSTQQRLMRHSLSTQGSLRAQLSELRSFRRRATTALDIAKQVALLRHRCADLAFGFVPEWTTAEGLDRVAEALGYSADRAHLQSVTAQIKQVAEAVRMCGRALHPKTQELYEAVASRDAARMEDAFDALAALVVIQRRHDMVGAARKLVAASQHELADNLFAWGDPVSATRLSTLPAAWSWMRAELWLRRVCDPDRQETLTLQLEVSEERTASAVASLAAELAWNRCLSSMTEDHRRHLVAWSLAMKKLGKGTGKYASLHRAEARKHMQSCKDVIPAWIMPLYKVAETLDPQPNIFDVAIVDEASQSGPEALFVAYIAKKVIVVGDDQQISPDDVGINVQAVQDLIELHLEDMPFKGVFGVRSSLFDQGKQFFGHPLRLREHFRCMPEIIQFSNNLCYADQPLEPLRQFGADRLEPIIVRRVENGYQEDGRGTINQPEAMAIVEAIVELCGDRRYDGKSLGVISLLSSSKQAQLVERLLLEHLGAAEMARRRIVCGDAYDFQGDERDVIFLSMVNAPNRRIGTLSSDADKRRFNVAVSRAKDQLWLFHSAELKDLGQNCYRRKLLEYCLNPNVSNGVSSEGINVDELRRLASRTRSLGTQPEPFDSWFEVDVFLRIVDRGFRVVPQYESGGYFIDLMVQGMNGSLAVECDGEQWHGAEQYDADVARQRKLERCGLRFWRVTESTFRRDPDAAMDGLWSRLDELSVRSDSRSDRSLEEEPVARVFDVAESVASVAEPTPYVNLNLEVLRTASVSTASQSRAPSVAADPTPSSNDGLGLRQYVSWQERHLPDPRAQVTRIVEAGLLEILQAEGPVSVERLYHQYAKGAGIQRVKSRARASLDTAVSSLVRSGAMSRRTESLPDIDSMNVAYITGTPDVAVRERGERELDEVPPTEMLELLARIAQRSPAVLNSEESYVRALQEAYNLSRVSASARARFGAVAQKLSASRLGRH